MAETGGFSGEGEGVGSQNPNEITRKPSCLFEDAFRFFKEEEKDQADIQIKTKKRLSRPLVGEENWLMLNWADIFYKNTREDDKSISIITNENEKKTKYWKITHTKLYHLFSCSSLSEEEWRELPMDTADKDMAKLIDKLCEEYKEVFKVDVRLEEESGSETGPEPEPKET